jgi:hypothetical protein
MGICICCCCNKHTTNCLENTLIVFNSINFIFYILGFILIGKDCVHNLIYINIIPFVFLFFNILTLVLVKIFVELETIFTTQRKLCCIFAYISMFLSIICFVFAVLVASFCLKELLESKEKCKTKDEIMIYLSCGLTGALCLIASFLWYNLMKRIKYCVRGKMIEDRGLINYGVLGGYLGRNNHKNRGRSTGRLSGSETIYVKNNMNTTRNISNINSFVGNYKKESNMNEISEQPDEESNSSNQEEEKEVKVQESIEDEF